MSRLGSTPGLGLYDPFAREGKMVMYALTQSGKTLLEAVLPAAVEAVA